MWYIKTLLFGLTCCTAFAANAQNKDSVVGDSNTTRTLNVAADSNKKDVIKAATYHALLVGLDAVKLAYNVLDSTKFRIEAIAEYKWKGSTWLSAEYGLCNANYAGAFVAYKSRSSGVSIGVSKAFFESKNPKDIDNAFVGVQLGGVVANTTQATYTITDVWGTNTGIIPGQTKTVFFAGLTGGFRFKVAKNIVMGWRAKGKVLINPRAFGAISPIYIALYGKGDKQTLFDYNMYMCWQLH
jgi:hypothetical protein